MERVMQQAVGVASFIAGAQVVGPVIEDRINLLLVHEVLELDRAGAFAGGGVDLVLIEQHILTASDLVTLRDLLVRNLLALLRADPLLLDRRAIGSMHLVKVHAPVLNRRMHPDRFVDPPEGSGSLPERTRHVLLFATRV